MPKKKAFRLSISKIATSVVAMVLIYLAVIFVRSYQESQIESEGIITCNDKVCEKSVHIHAQVQALVCGQELDIKRHKGDTDQQHTHDEKSLMHIHETITLDPSTKEILDPSPLFINNFFENMDINFTQTCLADKCNGDLCPDGHPGKVTVTVNGVVSPDVEKYIWQDGDNIIVSYK
jgi:hypothetical protein